jgi:hypothetical protein
MLSTNTHFFDGKLHSSKGEIQVDLDRVAAIDVNTKRAAFSTLQRKLTFTPTTLRCYQAVISTFERNRGANYDPTNDLHADDLLYLIYEKVCIEENEEYERMLLEQLEDMQTGLCPQGRTTRLFQVLLALKG